MLYVSAVFLFLFLPLTLGVYALVPARYKKYALLASGVLFYIFANMKTPLAIPVLAAVALLTYIVGRILARRCGKIIFALIVAAYGAAFIALRVIYEASDGAFLYPLGAAVYLLMAVSYLIDIRRGDAEGGGLVDSLLYLTYFPVMAAGPVVKYKDFKKYLGDVSFNINNFALGAKLFVTGFIEVVAVSAVMTETYKNILGISVQGVNAAFGLLAALLACFAAFFALAGWTDMGAGISRMFGINLPRDCAFAPVAYSPPLYFGAIARGLGGWIDDYITAPAAAALGGKKKLSAALGSALPVLLLSLFIRTTPTMLLVGMFASLLAAIFRLSGADDMLRARKYMRPLGWLVTTALAALFWTAAAAASDGHDFFAFFSRISFSAADFKIYYVHLALSGGTFVAVAAAALFLLAPLSYYGRAAALVLPKKIVPTLDALLMLLLIGAFVFAIMFFMPQYPYYASRAFEYLVF